VGVNQCIYDQLAVGHDARRTAAQFVVAASV
jgi:hypothetical protein